MTKIGSEPQVPAPLLSAAEVLAAIDRANEWMPSLTVEACRGDNLAIALCTYFDDGEGVDDETTWSRAATEGYEQMVEAIRQHYRAAIESAIAKAKAQ